MADLPTKGDPFSYPDSGNVHRPYCTPVILAIMDCLTWFLITADVIGFVFLIRKLKKNRFKRKYHLSNKRIYFLNLFKY